jgi:hypothetical protein
LALLNLIETIEFTEAPNARHGFRFDRRQHKHDLEECLSAGTVIAGLPAGHLRAATRDLLSGVAFVFCRETLTADYFRRQGVGSPVIEFGPDATFALQLRDDVCAAAYLQAQGLEAGRFICVIPRLRYTPYYRLQGKKPDVSDRAKDAVNDRTIAADHAKLRDLMVACVQRAGLKILACPEMRYQIELARTHLVEPLPEDVKRCIGWRDTYWLPTEAASVYASAVAVVSCECHSPTPPPRRPTCMRR